eukprot:scaffold289732_cov35-Tisochrysis_lutea.AAC.3
MARIREDVRLGDHRVDALHPREQERQGRLLLPRSGPCDGFLVRPWHMGRLDRHPAVGRQRWVDKRRTLRLVRWGVIVARRRGGA